MPSPTCPALTARRLRVRLAEAADDREIVRLLHDSVHLDDGDVARAAGVLPVTVRRWRSRSPKSKIRRWEQVDDIRALTALLVRSGLLEPGDIRQWLRGRNSDLGYQRPLDLIRAQEFERVLVAAETYLRRLQGLDDERCIPTKTARTLPDSAERVAPSQSGSELTEQGASRGDHGSRAHRQASPGARARQFHQR